MRYHYEKPAIYSRMYGEVYRCNHPLYDVCTLFKIEEKGLAVIQQRFNEHDKTTKWTGIDPWLNDILYTNPKFKAVFDKLAGEPVDRLYPTVSVRQLMWALKIKPMKKERWETVFDRKLI